MLCSVHVGELGWVRRPDLEAKNPALGQVWQSPRTDQYPEGRIKAFGPGRKPNVLHKTVEDFVMPNYAGW